tara:strand:- start:516 stop:692 length:177 start_codon:yes stop_codon:yes gene_type:complete
MLQIDREVKNIALTESEIEHLMSAMSAIYPSDKNSEIRHKRILRELTKALNSTNTIFE